MRGLQQSLHLTVFMVTHDIDTLRATTDRIAVLVDGKLTVGTIASLRDDPNPWIHEYLPACAAAQRSRHSGRRVRMEARANYVAVGAFVLVVLALILVGTSLVCARSVRNTQYQYIETNVAGPVSGLGTGAAVRLNGIEVGRVAKIDARSQRSEACNACSYRCADDSKFMPNSVASIESQGLTGVSYVEISGGTLSSPLLIAAAGQKYPQIASRPSSLQEVFDNAPELLSPAAHHRGSVGIATR